jgi:predicted Fe-Mo cluster-binding NifX family protein
MDDRIAEHFGRASTFTLVQIPDHQVEIVDNRSEHMGGRGLPADLLAGHGAEVVLCTGLGRRAIGLLTQHGITVHLVEPGTVRQAVTRWSTGTLSAVTDNDACTRHVFHDHDR